MTSPCGIFLPVLVPTVVYAAVALRWAIDQFQREDVLFREAEQFSLSAWVRHLLRDREPMPTGGQATLCFALILTSTWFLMQYLARQGADAGLGQRGRRSIDHLASPGRSWRSCSRRPPGGRCAWSGPSRATSCWPSRWSWHSIPGQRAAAGRRVAFSHIHR